MSMFQFKLWFCLGFGFLVLNIGVFVFWDFGDYIVVGVGATRFLRGMFG